MLGIPLRYLLKHPLAGLADLSSDPVEVWTTIRETYLAEKEQREPSCTYETDDGWERRLHEWLGVGWPCKRALEFWTLWSQVTRELEEKGIQSGPMSFQSWNDGDAGFVRAIWCLVRHLMPNKIVETGVAHGVSSRFVLEALEANGKGHLWSIDRPPLEREWRKQVGIAIEERNRPRWSYISGSSRRRLSELLSDLGEIDLFIHDSLHSERNVRFELDLAWDALSPRGAVVVDDIDANQGFRTFTQAFRAQEFLICEAEPLRCDPRRFNQKGLFGIILALKGRFDRRGSVGRVND